MKVAKSIIDYSNSAWTYQSAEQYDKYYSGGTRSVYNYLYNNKIISHDFHIIQKAILKIARYKDSIDTMDFGCGNVRHQVVYETIASALEKKGKKINLIAYEISKTALEYYMNMLLANGFWESNKKPDNNRIIKILTKNNITVHFFYANIQDNLNELAKLIGKLDITFSIFGVLAHIQTRALRQNTMLFLGNITTSDIILSFPGRHVLLKEQQTFKTFSLNVNILRINKILSEALLLKYPLLSMIDEYIAIVLSYILPNILKENLVSYYLVSVSKQK